MTAPDLSADEARTLARFEAAPAAEESLRERVARAMHDAACCEGCNQGPDAQHRIMADAAIAACRGEQ